MACPVPQVPSVSTDNDRWVTKLDPKQKVAYFAFLRTLRINNPDDVGRQLGKKRYYKRARDAFLQGGNTLDKYSLPNYKMKASINPRG